MFPIGWDCRQMYCHTEFIEVLSSDSILRKGFDKLSLIPANREKQTVDYGPLTVDSL
jgi:hypothetical protein